MEYGDEQLDPQLDVEFGELLGRTTKGSVKKILERNKALLLKHEVTSEEALQGLTREDLVAFGLSTATAAALKEVFPSATTTGDIARIQLQLNNMQVTLSRVSPRLDASMATHIKSSMFMVFRSDEGVERGKTQLTEANLLAHEANEASTSSAPPGGAPYTPLMFVGMGFFYLQPGLAAAPAHLLTQQQLQGKARVRILMPVSGKELELQVVQNCVPVDLAYMRLVNSTPEASAGLEFISPEDKFADEVGVQTRVEFFSTSLGPWGRVGGPRRNIDIIWTHGKINMMASQEFHYTVSTWAGDCGGPIIMTKGGKLLGMHVAMDNPYDITSSKKRKSNSDRISALESSAASSGPHIAVALAVTAFPAPPTNV